MLFIISCCCQWFESHIVSHSQHGLAACRLEVTCQLANLLDAAPKKELENILQLVRGIFNVEAALIALFGDRRIYITNSTGGFKVSVPAGCACWWVLTTSSRWPLQITVQCQVSGGNLVWVAQGCCSQL